MGPVRSLYEQEGELERAVMQKSSGGGPLTLRPVQMSDCGKRRNASGVLCKENKTRSCALNLS